MDEEGRRAVIGRLVENLMELRGIRREDIPGLSKPLVTAIRQGHPVSRTTYRAVEPPLGLPFMFLDLIYDGNVERIARVSGVPADIREWVLAELGAEVPECPPSANEGHTQAL